MAIDITKNDVLDSFDDGKSILLSNNNFFENLKPSECIKLDEINYRIREVRKSKNRVLITID